MSMYNKQVFIKDFKYLDKKKSLKTFIEDIDYTLLPVHRRCELF